MREKVSSPMGSGVIAIITILLVLILAIFSTLTLSTARADLALSQRGADTVSDYYAADGVARALLQEFRNGNEALFEMIVPMNEMQGIYVHAERQADGTLSILAWQAVLLDDFSDYADRTLPVWTGEE